MADPVTIDEFHLSVLVPPHLPESECEAIRRVLDGRRFQARLLRAVRRAFRRRPALRKVRLRLSR